MSSIEYLPNETLCDIFEWVYSPSLQAPEPPPLTSALRLSHVTSRWRNISIDLPPLWTHIRISHFRDAEMVEILFNRSKELSLDISIHCLTSAPPEVSSRLWMILTSIVSRIPRCCRLSIITTTSNFLTIEKRFGGNPINSPQLKILELIQSEDGQIVHFPSLDVDPRVLSSVILDHVVLISSFPYFLAGLNSLDIRHSYWFGLWDMMPLVMPELRHLTICATVLPRITIFSSLTYLKIGGPWNARHYLSYFMDLSTPALECLELSDLPTREGWWELISIVQDTVSKYPAVQSLSLSTLKLVGLDIRFAHAFPNLQHLKFVNVDPEPILKLLREEPSIWPSLCTITVDGLEVERPCQI